MQQKILEQLELEAILEKLYDTSPFIIDESMEARVKKAYALVHPEVSVQQVKFDTLGHKFVVMYVFKADSSD